VTVRLAARAGTAESRMRQALHEMTAGTPVIVVDDQTEGEEGFIAMPADAATTGRVAFFVRHSSGLLCVAMSGAECDRLRLPPMAGVAPDSVSLAACVTVDAVAGVTTGISAHDRATTVALLASGEASAEDFTRPGHVMPVRAADGGVLRRPGVAEAVADLAQAAGRQPAGLFAALVSTHRPTEVAQGAELHEFAAEHGLVLISVSDLIEYRRTREPLVTRQANTRLPLGSRDTRVVGYRGSIDGAEHVAVAFGEPARAEDFPVYVHTECLTGDVFQSVSCRCRDLLDCALATIASEGRGAVIYLRPSSGPTESVLLCGERVEDDPSVPFVVAHIVQDLGVSSVRLLWDHSPCRAALQAMGLPTRIQRSAVAAVS
jgi:3,4-dihydroxy 2-butanone 4-phosphate synthase/GTP cyclohydrolase II